MHHRPAAPDRSEQLVTFERVDAAVRTTGLLLRAAAYAVIGNVASHSDYGLAFLTGVLVGDFAGSLIALVQRSGQSALQSLAEMALLGVVLLWVRDDLIWPADQALRAVICLAATAVVAGRIGRNATSGIGHE